jgi:lipopolysaccharide export LptBFGC system permease protein LptF
MAFTIGLLLIFVYYLIFVLGEVASLKGTLSPLTGLWMANASFLVLGWGLYRVASQERQAFALPTRPRKGRDA